MKENRKIEDDFSLTQKTSILLLGANASEPVRGKIWFQKELFLIAQNIKELAEETDFEPDYIGPYSETADEELDHLRIEGIVEGEREKLTLYGQQVNARIGQSFSSDFKRLVSEIKTFLNDLSKDELLGFIYFSYPDMKVESIEFERIARNRKEIAISLFKKGKVSLGKAAIIAGITQEELIETFSKIGINVFSR